MPELLCICAHELCSRQNSTLFHHYETDAANLEDMWFSDEALFHLSGRVNRHKTRFWGKEIPVEIREHQSDSPNLVVWCAMSIVGLIGPCFFKKENGDAENVNGANYLHMLQNFFLPKLSQVAVNRDEVIFQQDGAPAHYSRDVRTFLDEKFPDRWIGRRGPIEWAPRSPDLTPCDFFLWGYIKSRVYATKPADLSILENRIRDECGSITPDMLSNVGEACVKKWLLCHERGGAHVEVHQ